MIRRQPLTAIALLASLAGLGISVYLTYEHYHAAVLSCNLAVFNCAQVLSSPYATLPLWGLPTASAGILFFLVNGFLLAARGIALAKGHPSPFFANAALAWASVGLLAVLGLLFTEIVQVGAFCEWCTAVHAIVVLNFLLLVYQRSAAASSRPAPARPRRKA